MYKARKAGSDILKMKAHLMSENNREGISFYLLPSTVREDLINIFQKLGYPGAAKEVEDLDQLVDFLLVDPPEIGEGGE